MGGCIQESVKMQPHHDSRGGLKHALEHGGASCSGTQESDAMTQVTQTLAHPTPNVNQLQGCNPVKSASGASAAAFNGAPTIGGPSILAKNVTASVSNSFAAVASSALLPADSKRCLESFHHVPRNLLFAVV